MDNKEKLDNVIDSLISKDDVLSIGYIGSLAKKFDLSKCRDVDLLVIVDEDKPFEREIYSLDTLEFDISYISIDEITSQIGKKSVIWVKAIRDYRVIYLKNESIKEKIIQNKEIVSDFYNKYDKISDLQNLNHIKFLRYDISSKLGYMIGKKDDVVLYNHLKNSFVLNLVRLYFEINNMIIPKEKQQIREIKNTDEVLYNMLEVYYCGNSIDDENFLFALTDYVLSKHGGRLYEFKKGYYPVNR
ncbi:MAG: hypothetical protein WBA54_06460 [Acidaminobacteraceae bacterium]